MGEKFNKNKMIVLMGMILIIGVVTARSLDKERHIIGRVVTNVVSDEGLVSFLVVTDEGKHVGVEIIDETYVGRTLGLIDDEVLKAGLPERTEVEIDYKGLPHVYTMKDGEKIKGIDALAIHIREALVEEVVRVEGAKVEVWEWLFGKNYKLEDGTVLLDVRGNISPEDVTAIGAESFHDLNEEAKKYIRQYYEEQGLLYDIQVELNDAYNTYSNLEDKNAFSDIFINQDILPTASNEEVIYFSSIAMLARNGVASKEIHRGTAFNRETGEKIENVALFSCPEEDLAEKIVAIAKIEDAALRNEMIGAFKSEGVVVLPEYIEVYFEAGTLASQEYDYAIALRYEDELLEILHDWAVPHRQNMEE